MVRWILTIEGRRRTAFDSQWEANEFKASLVSRGIRVRGPNRVTCARTIRRLTAQEAVGARMCVGVGG